MTQKSVNSIINNEHSKVRGEPKYQYPFMTPQTCQSSHNTYVELFSETSIRQ